MVRYRRDTGGIEMKEDTAKKILNTNIDINSLKKPEK